MQTRVVFFTFFASALITIIFCIPLTLASTTWEGAANEASKMMQTNVESASDHAARAGGLGGWIQKKGTHTHGDDAGARAVLPVGRKGPPERAAFARGTIRVESALS